MRVEGALSEGGAHSHVVPAEGVPQEGALGPRVLVRLRRLVADVPVVRGEHHPVAGRPLPPHRVLRHDPVAVEHRRGDPLRRRQVVGVLGAGLGDRARVLHRPQVRLPRPGALARALPLQEGEGAVHVAGHPLPLGARLLHVALHPGLHRARGARIPVQLPEAGEERRVDPGDVRGDGVEEVRSRVAEVVAHEADLVSGVELVVPPHPPEQVEVLLGVPEAVRLLEFVPHDLPDVAPAGADPLVDAESGGPGGLQGEGGEAPGLHEVFEDPVLRGEEVRRAVGGLADADDLGRADHPVQRAQIGQGPGGAGEFARGIGAGRGGGGARGGRQGAQAGGEEEPDERQTTAAS
ncbi:hypothetical protein STANM309S_02787 [Streptomyces tanashiensis]